MDYLDKLENKISQGARFEFAIEANYFWCVKSESILDNYAADEFYSFGLTALIENWVKSSYILN